MREDEDVDDLFAEFHKSRDADLLGHVFERTAPALLRHARRLTGSDSDAEDLVQGVFLSALQDMQNFDTARPCMPYLYGVLRLQAKSMARRRRPHATADEDPAVAKPTIEVVAAQEFASQVASAMAKLEPPSREVVRLYLDAQQRPREIAAQLGRTTGTVRVQLHRGLAKLRQLLPVSILALLLERLHACPQSLGGPSASAMSHAASARWSARGATIAVMAAVLVVALAIWVGPGLRSTAIAQVGARVQEDRLAAAEPARTSALPVARRRLQAASDDAVSATLTAQLYWTDDGAMSHDPATNVGATLHHSGRDPLLSGRRATADATGRVHFTDLSVGSYVLQLDRGPRRIVTVAAGANELSVALHDSRQVSGRVIDVRGQPIADASIWVSERPGHIWNGQVVGRTGSDGAFELRGVDPRTYVTAMVDGFAAPPLQVVGGEPGRPLELRVAAPGASLSGTVVDAHGAPVGDALVLVGSHPRSEQFVRGVARLDATRIAHTDSDGSFQLQSLTPGRQTVVVRHTGHATLAQPVTVSTSPTPQVTLQLQAGRVVRGYVRNAQGEPVADAFVHCTGDHRLAWSAVRTDRQGGYQVCGVPYAAVTLAVTAEGYDFEQRCNSARVADQDLTLTRTPVVRGKVIGHERFSRLQVCLDRNVRRRGDGPPPQFDVASDGAFEGHLQGGFEMNCVYVCDASQKVWVPAATRTTCDGALELSLPRDYQRRGAIEVPLDDVTEIASNNLRLLAVRGKWTYILEAERAGDCLRCAAIVPGSYDLLVDSSDGSFPPTPLGTCEVQPDRVSRTAPLNDVHGTLSFRFHVRGQTPRQLCAWVEGPNGIVTRLHGFEGEQALRPGQYSLSCTGSDVVPVRGRLLTVVGGQVTNESIALMEGQPCELHWQSTSRAASVCRIRDAAGAVFMEVDRLPDASGRISLATVLAPGSYVLDADTADGAMAADFTISRQQGECSVPIHPIAKE